MKTIAKAIVALVGAVSVWGITAATDNPDTAADEGAITTVEWFTLVGALGTAAAVYVIPNRDDA